LLVTGVNNPGCALADVHKIAGFPHVGTLSRFIEYLITAGFVSKQNLWSFKTNQPLKQIIYQFQFG